MWHNRLVKNSAHALCYYKCIKEKKTILHQFNTIMYAKIQRSVESENVSIPCCDKLHLYSRCCAWGNIIYNCSFILCTRNINFLLLAHVVMMNREQKQRKRRNGSNVSEEWRTNIRHKWNKRKFCMDNSFWFIIRW